MELTGICRIILCAATTTTFWNHSWPSPNSPSFSGTLPEDQVSIDNHHDLGTTKEETFVGHALDWWPNKRAGNNVVPVVTTVNVNVNDSVAVAILLTRRRIPVQIGIVKSSPFIFVVAKHASSIYSTDTVQYGDTGAAASSYSTVVVIVYRTEQTYLRYDGGREISSSIFWHIMSAGCSERM